MRGVVFVLFVSPSGPVYGMAVWVRICFVSLVSDRCLTGSIGNMCPGSPCWASATPTLLTQVFSGPRSTIGMRPSGLAYR